MQNAEQNEALALTAAAFEQASGQLSVVSGQLSDAIESAASYDALIDQLASGKLEIAAAIEGHLAIAIFNSQLLGRAQVWADVSSKESVVSRPDSRLTPHASRLSAIVLDLAFEPLPFDEAIAYWRRKTNVTPAQFDALSEAARQKAFTIAGRASEVIRGSIKDLIDAALTEGLTLRQFQSQANAVLDAAGVSPRTPWYWETVYRTNLATSYQAGRWQQMTDPDVVAERPYLQYFSARLPSSRKSHAEKHGVVLPVDDPFWRVWYPPNGFNCYCTVASVSQRELARDGLKISSKNFSFPDPDPGFATNAGVG